MVAIPAEVGPNIVDFVSSVFFSEISARLTMWICSPMALSHDEVFIIDVTVEAVAVTMMFGT